METPRASSAVRPLGGRKKAGKQAHVRVDCERPATAPEEVSEIRKRNREIWLEENREAIATYNELVSRHGVFSDGSRGF